MAISCRSINSNRLVCLLLLSLLLFGCTVTPPPLSPPLPIPSTGVVGEVTGTVAQPAAGAYVYAYRSSRSGLRGPADFEAMVQNDGSYTLDLAAGDYYLVARARGVGGDSGPMRAGDSWAAHSDNPVHLREGELLHIDFRLQPMVRASQLRHGVSGSMATGFSGTLTDDEGHAVAGSYVMAYRQGEKRGRPDYSAVSGEDGHFILYVPAPGPYCLVARSRLRGHPQAGELASQASSNEQECLAVESEGLREVGAIVLRPRRP